MICNILAPTDFSHDAYNALFYATQLYKHQKCTFHILHAYDNQSYYKKEFKGGRTTKKLLDYIGDRTRECLQEANHKINADTEKNPLRQFVTVPIKGSLEKAVKVYMAQNPIDLIVMGTKGRTWAEDKFMGGNTIHMIKSKIDCPLLCIPKQMDYRPISRLGYITNFKHSLEKFSLSIVNSLASYHEASLHIVHVSDDVPINTFQEKNKALLEKYFDDTRLHFHAVPCEKSKARTVAKFAKAQEINLLAMCYYPHYFLDKLFREPVVQDLSFYTEIPLLILPTQE